MDATTFLHNVDWRRGPVTRTVRGVEVVRCTPTSSVYGFLISDSIIECRYHWYDGRSTPHLTNPKMCEGCRNHLGMRRRGYALIWRLPEHKIRIVEFTDKCIDEDMLLSSPTSHLRGRCVTVKKKDPANGKRPHKGSPAECVWGPAQAPQSLPLDFDFRPSLGLLFGFLPNMHGVTRYVPPEGGDA